MDRQDSDLSSGRSRLQTTVRSADLDRGDVDKLSEGSVNVAEPDAVLAVLERLGVDKDSLDVDVIALMKLQRVC